MSTMLFLGSVTCFYYSFKFRKKYKISITEKDSNIAMGLFMLGIALLIALGLNINRIMS